MSATQAAEPAPQPILSSRGIVKHFGGVVAGGGPPFGLELGLNGVDWNSVRGVRVARWRVVVADRRFRLESNVYR